MKGLIQLLLLLTPAWASARHNPEHKKKRKTSFALPCNAEKLHLRYCVTQRKTEKNMIIFVIMVLFILAFSWGQQIVRGHNMEIREIIIWKSLGGH